MDIQAKLAIAEIETKRVDPALLHPNHVRGHAHAGKLEPRHDVDGHAGFRLPRNWLWPYVRRPATAQVVWPGYVSPSSTKLVCWASSGHIAVFQQHLESLRTGVLNYAGLTGGSCGEVPSGSFTTAPSGAFTGPRRSGSAVRFIQASRRPRIWVRALAQVGSATRLWVSFGSKITSNSCSRGTSWFLQPFCNHKSLLGDFGIADLTSGTIGSRSPTMGSGTVRARRSGRHLWNRPSTRW